MVSIDRPCVPTQSPVYLQGPVAWNFKKPVTTFRAKKGGVFLKWIALTKIHKGKRPTNTKLVMIYLIKGYSSCTNTPPAASVAVPTGVELLRPCAARDSKERKQNENFRNLVALYQLSLQVRWRQGEYRHMGCMYLEVITRFWIFGSAIHSKKDSTFLTLNTVTGFL
jgi:hypothetical protein